MAQLKLFKYPPQRFLPREIPVTTHDRIKVRKYKPKAGIKWTENPANVGLSPLVIYHKPKLNGVVSNDYWGLKEE